MKPLTIVYITSRENSKLDWFLDCFHRAIAESWNDITVIIVSPHSEFVRSYDCKKSRTIITTHPKPTVWQGPSRLTKQDWWAASNARNTGIALCRTEWIAFVDDRCVLMPGWLDSIKQAMEGEYAVFGAYEKRVNMKVENGLIVEPGEVIGRDDREQYTMRYWAGLAPAACPGEWSYGCNIALPLEWALQIGGFSESADGSGAEDTYFGKMLQNNGFMTKYDYRMKVIQDRTPTELGTPMRKEDFGVSPNDWSHRLMNQHLPLKRAPHPFDIRQLREDALAGNPWPEPWGPKVHGWDSKPLEGL